MTPIRLLAIDLDGTLLDSTWTLSNINRDALRAAYDHGVQIVFVTGRRYHTAKPITSTCEFPHFVITTAGAVTRSSSAERLFLHTLDRDLVREVLLLTEHLRPWTFMISEAEGMEDVFCESPLLENLHVARYVQRNEEFLVRVPSLPGAVTASVLELVLIGYFEEMRNAAEFLDRLPIRHRLNVLRTEYPERDLCLLDILDSSTNKGAAVKQLAESLGIPRNSVMALGDNHSDIDMLKYAGCPVVMKNATDELRTAGWPITASNDDNGVAQAIGEFILKMPLQIPAQ